MVKTNIKRYGIFFLTLITLFMILIGCATDDKQSIYTDEQRIVQEGDSYSFYSRTEEEDDKRLRIDFSRFSGVQTIMELQTEETSKLRLKYVSLVDNGNFKMVLVTEDKKIVKVVEQSDRGILEIAIKSGKNTLKIVGQNAKGYIQLEVLEAGEKVTLIPQKDGTKALPEVEQTFSAKQLTEDVQQLEKTIMKKNPLYFADQEALSQLFSDAYQGIEEDMNELTFYRLLNPVVAAVNCGHTNLSVSETLYTARKEEARFFPLKVTLVGSSLYTLENDPSVGIAAGDEIQSINGLVSKEIISKLTLNISGDGDYHSKRNYIISKNFNSRFYDFVDNADEFEVVFINQKGEKKKAHLKAQAREEFNTTAWDLHFKEYKDGNYYEARIDEDHAVLNIHVFMEEKDNKFKPFLASFFEEIKTKNINRLIIDLRGNYGGDSFMAKELLSYLSAKEFSYFDGDLPLLYDILGFTRPIKPKDGIFPGKVVVLTDGACFSTTAHFCALVKYHGLAMLIGDETGGSYVCTDASKDVVLKNTKLRLHYATQTFQVRVDKMSDSSGVIPDIPVSPSIEDIVNSRDTIMEVALEAIK